MTDNETIADLIGKRITRDLPGDKQQWQLPMCNGYYPSSDTLEFDKRWERLIPAYYKFRELPCAGPMETVREFTRHCSNIEDAILHLGPTPAEACRLLADGIRWYKSIKQ